MWPYQHLDFGCVVSRAMTEKFVLNYPIYATLVEQYQETKRKRKGSLFQAHCIPGKVFILPPSSENFLLLPATRKLAGSSELISVQEALVVCHPLSGLREVVEEGGNGQCWHRSGEVCQLGLQFAHLGNRGINNYHRTGPSGEHEFRYIWKIQRQTSTSPKQSFHTWTRKDN